MSMNVNQALEMLREKKGSHRYSCYVPSLDRECMFKPVTVAELKSVSKIAIDENDENFMMAATALILDVCTEDLDPKILTDLDRIKLILDIKVNNQMSDDVYKITCRECGSQYSVNLDYENMIKKLSISPKSEFLKFTDDDVNYEIELNLPSIDILCKFRQYIANTNKELEQKDASDEEKLKVELYFASYSPMLFVKNIKINDQEIEGFNQLSISDRDIFLNELPAALFEKITNTIVKNKDLDITRKMRNSTNCPGCNIENTYDPSIEDFFVI